MKNVLVIGATGAMGTYLVPILLAKGYTVTGVTLEDAVSDRENLTYVKANGHDIDFIRAELAKGYDGVVDFMSYPTTEMFEPFMDAYLSSVSHYIFLSTYRVYSYDTPIVETSPRVYDRERPDTFVDDREYCIYKAKEEDMLRASGKKNFSIVRPAITYSKRRFQLVTLEAEVVVRRMLEGKTLVLPEGVMEKQATMSWAGDVARMLDAVLFNEKAMGETYTVATAEHHTWREIAEIYRKIGGLDYVTVDNETFLQIWAEGYVYCRQQLNYDRMYDRIVDNTKILSLMGETQEDLMPLEEGLRRELAGVTLNDILDHPDTNARMDAYLASLAKS